MAHQKIGEAGKKAGIVDGFGAAYWPATRSAPENAPAFPVRLPASQVWRLPFLADLAGIAFVFRIAQHFFPEVTYFETKSL